MAQSGQIVIVGAGRAGASFVESYREAGGEDLVVMLGSEGRPPYNRPPLSKGIVRGEMEPDQAIAHDASELEDMLVDLRLDTDVAAVETDRRVVRTSDGDEVGYGRLIIATGTRPRTLPIEGADLPAVMTLRTLDDAIALREHAQTAHRAVVVGGSFIGSEVAASLRLAGLDVSIVELGDRLVPALGSEEISTQVSELFAANDVDVFLGEQVEEFEANGRSLTGVRLASGDRVEGFLAVVGVGVQPNVEFLAGSGIEVGDGVIVDDHFRASVDDVYAIGDVAHFDDVVSGRRRRIEHWSNADAQGRHLGRMLAGSGDRFEHVPAFFTMIFDVKLQLLGDLADVDEVVIRGSLLDHNLVALYLREDRLAAAAVVGQTDDVARDLGELIHQRAPLSDRGSIANLDVRATALFGS